jgi:D-sedoheptulose 7-phosphate isomerase
VEPAHAARGVDAVSTAEPTGFLYPFLDRAERDETGLLAALAASGRAKAELSAATTTAALAAAAPEIAGAAIAIARRARAGGRILTIGNGGSATDAELAAACFARPSDGPAVPARALVDDPAVLTALANDIGVEAVFARQVEAAARPGDVLLAFSTSGNSPNLLAAIAQAHRQGLYTLGMAGHDGGAMARCAELDCCLVVRAQSVHRVQEAQDTLVDALRRAVCVALEDRTEEEGDP